MRSVRRQPQDYLIAGTSHDRFPEIAGRSVPVKMLKDRIGIAADSPLDILITGESGTGKELVARAISNRRHVEKFIPVDCGALSDSLAEAELFGYCKGAFTGAMENRQGLLEAADSGTLFLDEISNMSLKLQAKLLRVLQEREVRRIGETRTRKLDVRVIAATNEDLVEKIKKGQFRNDLFYRLKVMEIRVPSLRERSDDIPLLIEWFLSRTAGTENGKNKRFTPEAMELLAGYSFPGNIRELKNTVASAYYAASGCTIEAWMLPPEVYAKNISGNDAEVIDALRLYRMILDGKGAFDDQVKEPYLKRRFGTSIVRGVIKLALADAGGFYRDAFARLRILNKHYSATIQFLKRHQCYLNFRPFRHECGTHLTVRENAAPE